MVGGGINPTLPITYLAAEALFSSHLQKVSRTDGVAAALRSCDSRPDKLRLALRRKGWSGLLLGGFLLGGERSR
jgi:hypothetical protein